MSHQQYGHISRKKPKSPWRWAALIVPAVWGLMVAIRFGLKAADLVGGSPWGMLHWSNNQWGHPAVQHLLDNTTLLFAAPLVVCGFLMILATHKPKGRNDLHGSARWALYKDIQEMGYLNG